MMEDEDEDEEALVLSDDLTDYHIISPITSAEGGRVMYKAYYIYDNGIFGIQHQIVQMICVKLSETEALDNLSSQLAHNYISTSSWDDTPRYGRMNNLLCRSTFESRGYFCAVLDYMNHGSLLSLMVCRFPLGLPEFYILYALCTALKALSVIHANSHRIPFHRQISAAHMYAIGYNGAIIFKLGYAAMVHDLLEDQVSDSSASSVCRWAAAPEVYEDDTRYGAEADIWLVGITALELAYGGLRLGGRDDLEHLIRIMHTKRRLPSKLNSEGCHCWEKERKRRELVLPFLLSCIPHSKKRTAPTGFEYRPEERVFSKGFVDLVLACLDLDPTKRPTASELIGYNIFDKVRDRTSLRL
ncbi:STE20/SPS1-related proline-alanine-rich protein kinase [Orobanche hederae]